MDRDNTFIRNKNQRQRQRQRSTEPLDCRIHQRSLRIPTRPKFPPHMHIISPSTYYHSKPFGGTLWRARTLGRHPSQCDDLQLHRPAAISIVWCQIFGSWFLIKVYVWKCVLLRPRGVPPSVGTRGATARKTYQVEHRLLRCALYTTKWLGPLQLSPFRGVKLNIDFCDVHFYTTKWPE